MDGWVEWDADIRGKGVIYRGLRGEREMLFWLKGGEEE